MVFIIFNKGGGLEKIKQYVENVEKRCNICRKCRKFNILGFN